MQLKSLAICAAVASVCSTAYAQSSVTLYGIADVSARYQTNADAQGHSRVSLENGAITNSRWGLRGREDLGSGLAAIFTLEAGINLDSGTQSNSSKLFNRQAYVGMSDAKLGTLTLGLQNTPIFDLAAGSFDPLTFGNYINNSWADTIFGLGGRRGKDNTVKYVSSFGPVTTWLYYGFGEAPGGMKAGNIASGAVSYASGPLGLAVAVSDAHDASNNRQFVVNANATYAIGNAKLFAGYFGGKDATGFSDTVLIGNTAANPAHPRKDDVGFVGARYTMTPALTLIGAVYYGWASNVQGVEGSDGKGKRATYVALAEYSLSKRTTLYGTIDFNHATGRRRAELANNATQLGAALGMRHRF